MSIVKIKITDDRLIVVSDIDSDRRTDDFEGTGYSQFGTVRNAMNNIAGDVYQLVIGELPADSLVQAEVINIRFDNESVAKIKISGTITRVVRSSDGNESVTTSWKTKDAITAGLDAEISSGSEILTKVANLVQIISNNSN